MRRKRKEEEEGGGGGGGQEEVKKERRRIDSCWGKEGGLVEKEVVTGKVDNIYAKGGRGWKLESELNRMTTSDILGLAVSPLFF